MLPSPFLLLGLMASPGFSPRAEPRSPLYSRSKTSIKAVVLPQDTSRTHPSLSSTRPAIFLFLLIRECFASRWGGVFLLTPDVFSLNLFSFPSSQGFAHKSLEETLSIFLCLLLSHPFPEAMSTKALQEGEKGGEGRKYSGEKIPVDSSKCYWWMVSY